MSPRSALLVLVPLAFVARACVAAPSGPPTPPHRATEPPQRAETPPTAPNQLFVGSGSDDTVAGRPALGAKVEAPAAPLAHKPPLAHAAPPRLGLTAALGHATAAERCLPDVGQSASLDRHDVFAAGEVVLTFDDGPYADRTPPVLDRLAERGFTATFFVLGRHITRNTYRLLQRMEAEGHIIGSHSYDHDLEMAYGPSREQVVAYVQGQHETTRILIELALLATSADDFDAMHTTVFGIPSRKRLDRGALRTEWPTFVARHRAVLAARGAPGARYPVRFARPPGGGPYLGASVIPRARHDEALRALGMINVMWHAESGDVHPTDARDRSWLAHNLIRGAKRGGVLLIHDFIRNDALASALTAMKAAGTHVLSLEAVARRKHGCSTEALTMARRAPSPPAAVERVE